jgi:hypothetical protein
MCEVCGRPLHFGESKHCQSAECRQGSLEKLLAENAKRRREDLDATVLRDGEALLATLRPAFPEGALEPVVIRLPYRDTKLVPLPRSRRSYHRAHLEALVETHWDTLGESAVPSADEPQAGEPAAGRAAGNEVIADETAPTRNLPKERGFFANTCAACRGYCCGPHVPGNYLNRNVLMEFRRRHPDASPDDFVEQYMNLVPAETFRDQCVYQGEHGCGLPRDMRPQICRDHKCDGFVAVERLAPSLREGSSFVALRVADTIKSAVIVSVDGYRDVERPEADPPSEV